MPELPADHVCLRVVQLIEDGERLLPSVVGLTKVAVGVEDVAEEGERPGLAMAIAELLEQFHGAPPVGDRLPLLSQMLVRVAEVVPGIGLAAKVSEFLV